MKRLTPAAMTLALLAVQQAYAQQSPEATLPTIDIRAATEAINPSAKQASVAGFDDAPLKDTPASVTVVTQQTLQNQQAKLLTDIIKNDASMGESYAPVGYYENIAIRGFPLDYASSYQINGMSAAGEQSIALDNKERVEILKGVAALQNGASSPGGLVNYVTKRPANVRSVMFGIDSNGSRLYSTDLGILFGANNQFGLRVNAAHEDINSYVEHADGRREFASVAASWIISPKAALQFNIEHQEKVQRSVSGYQLLGNTTVPANASRTKLLGYQSWMDPVKVSSLNMDLRLDYELSSTWRTYVAASRSRTVIDDNVAFAFGGSTTFPNNYFDANGNYDIYDYRIPNDTRVNDQAKAVLLGQFDTGSIRHDLTVGVSTTRRTVNKPDDRFAYIGNGNIYQPVPEYSPSTLAIPDAYRNLDSRQQAIFVTDKIRFNDQWQLIAGGRQIWLQEKNYDATGTTTRDTSRTEFLPQLAVIYQPTQQTTLYTSYTKNLALGIQTPWWVTNGSIFLPPATTQQIEAGIKHDLTNDVNVTAALFQMRKPFEYPQYDAGAAAYTYVQQGNQTHRGLELGINGNVTNRLHLAAGVTLIQAKVSDSGTANFDGHQAINVPRMRAALHADYRVPGIDNLNATGSWIYSAKKAANREGTVEVPSFNIFNAGLRYQMRIAGNPATIRLTVDNLLNKYYWKDVSEYLSDGYLHLGAPRTARLSLQYDF
jgi:iron complex outermembrane receptor protein